MNSIVTQSASAYGVRTSTIKMSKGRVPPDGDISVPLKLAQEFALAGGFIVERSPKKYVLVSKLVEIVIGGLNTKVAAEPLAKAEAGPIVPMSPLVTTQTSLLA